MSPTAQPRRAHQPRRGAALLALSALFFALMGVCIREATVLGVGNEMVVFFRNAVGVLFFLPLALTRGLAPLRTARPWSHLKRSACGLAAMYCYFYALAHLPLTDAMLFSYAAPVFTPLIAWWWLREPLTARMLLATAIGFAGVLLVAKPSGAVVSGIALIGILASVMAACAFVSIREMSNTEPAFRIVFYFALFSALVSAVPLLWAWQPLDRHQLLLLLATAIGFSGVLLVAKPSGALVSGISLIGILASLMAACAFVSIREMSDSEPAFRIVFYFALFSALISAIPLLWAWQPLQREQLVILLLAGLMASFGQLSMSKAYACAPPGLIGPVAYLAIVFAGIIAWLRWGETPGSTSLLGAGLIFAASLIPLLRRRP